MSTSSHQAPDRLPRRVSALGGAPVERSSYGLLANLLNAVGRTLKSLFHWYKNSQQRPEPVIPHETQLGYPEQREGSAFEDFWLLSERSCLHDALFWRAHGR